MDIFCTRMNKGRLRLNDPEVLLRCLKSLSKFWGEGENETILAQMRHEKQSLAALNEHFRNEIWAKMGRLQPDPKNLDKL